MPFITTWDDSRSRNQPTDSAEEARFYAEPADSVSLADTPLQTYTETVPKPPVLNSELTYSMCPWLLVPNSHNGSLIPVGELMEVQWINPADAPVGWMSIGIFDPDSGESYSVWSDVEQGQETGFLDLTTIPTGTKAGMLYLSGSDEYDREFTLMWEFW